MTTGPVSRWATGSIAVLTLTGAYVGGWAALGPRSFYDSFPGLHRVWVSVDGPFDEHLVRDVGGLYLALAVGGLLALRWRSPHAVALLGVAWTTFGALHLAYHLAHLEGFAVVDVVGQVVALGGSLLLAVVAVATSLPARGV